MLFTWLIVSWRGGVIATRAGALATQFAANRFILLRLNEMARVCELCGKGPQFGHKVSHAHNVSNRRWNVNIQSVRAIVNGAHKRLRACTSCIRNGKVQKVA